jgi:hypothetical protein
MENEKSYSRNVSDQFELKRDKVNETLWIDESANFQMSTDDDDESSDSEKSIPEKRN